MRLARRLLLLKLILASSACGGGESAQGPGSASDSSEVQTVESWVLSEKPLVEIGVREGEEVYQLHRVSGSVRLEDGKILVVNAGSRELRLFEADGSYLRTFGRDGEGPGEFRNPAKIRKLAPDSILVWDESLLRISFFDATGTFLGARQLLPTKETLFPGDEWLVGRNWIDSPVAPEDRGRVRQAVQAMPPAGTLNTVRFLRVTDDGWIWASDRRPPADTALSWTVYDLSGEVVAQLRTPPRFLPHEIGPDYILGRFQDEMDINYVRLYALNKPAGSPPAPGLLVSVGSGEPDAGRPSGPRVPEEVLAGIRSLVKGMASAQEIYYSDHYTYTTDLEALEEILRGTPFEEVEVSILFAGTDGWMGTFTHRATGAVCGLAYGFYLPMGWQPGTVLCP